MECKKKSCSNLRVESMRPHPLTISFVSKSTSSKFVFKHAGKTLSENGIGLSTSIKAMSFFFVRTEYLLLDGRKIS